MIETGQEGGTAVGTEVVGFPWFLWEEDGDLDAVAIPGEKLCDWSSQGRHGLLLVTEEPHLKVPDGFGAEPWSPHAPHCINQDAERTVFVERCLGIVHDDRLTAMRRWSFWVVTR